MKLFSKIFVVVLALAATLVLFSACAKKVVSISIKKSDMPSKTEYVVGQALDLTGGKITAVVGDEEVTVSLDDPAISVEGYDANKLGEQTVTITYEGKTTEITVNVKPRIVIEGAQKNFLVDETLDLSKGFLRLNNDNGTTETVALNAEGVTVTGFDAASAGEKTMTVTYKDYSATYTITVHSIADVDLKKPNKLTYVTHDAEMDLSGGYITFKSADGTLTRRQTLSADMITGFDLSAATEENRTTPLQQTITISYGGKELTSFVIEIRYSDVTDLTGKLDRLPALDWTGEQAPEIEAAVGELSVEILTQYYTMKTADRKLIDAEKLQGAVKILSVYGVEKWQGAMGNLENIITVTDEGMAVNYKGTYEQAKNALAVLADKTSDINVLSELLTTVAGDATFKDITLYGANIVGLYLNAVHETREFENVIDRLTFMTGVYESVQDVPDAWTNTTLTDYGTEIDSVYVQIIGSGYKARAERNMYLAISAWRANDDLIDLLYARAVATENQAVIDTLKVIVLPAELDAVYRYIVSAMDQISRLNAQQSVDTSMYFYYYFTAAKTLTEIREGPDELYKTLSNELKFGGLLVNGQTGAALDVTFDQLMSFLTSNGHNKYASVAVNDKKTYELLLEFVALMQDANDAENFLTSDEGKAAVASIIRNFVDLSPAWQAVFLNTICPYYRQASTLALFDYSETYMSNFTYYLVELAMKKTLSENVLALVDESLLAAEYFERYLSSANAEMVTKFLEKCTAMTTAYAAFSAQEKAEYDAYFGTLYAKYTALAAKYADPTNPTLTDLGEWAAKFDDLENYLNAALNAYNQIGNKRNVYSAFLAYYEHVRALVSDINENAPQAIKDAFMYECKLGKSDTSNGVTLDYGVQVITNCYVTMLSNLTVTISGSTYSLYIVYEARPDLQKAFYDVEYVISGYINAGEMKDVAAVKKAMASFRALSTNDQYLFLQLDGVYNMYYQGLTQFFNKNMTTAAAAAAEKLVGLEKAYLAYQVSPNGTNATSGKTNAAELKAAKEAFDAAYAALSVEDKASFDACMSEMQADYQAKYSELELA